MVLPSPSRAALALVFSLLAAVAPAGCCSAGACATDRLPSGGSSRTPRDCLAIARYAAEHECWRVLYDLMSERTRDEAGWVTFRLYIGSLTFPESELRIVDAIRSLTVRNVLDDQPERGLATAFVTTTVRVNAQMLLVSEEVPREDGRKVIEWRLGLKEMEERGWWVAVPD